MRGEGMEFGFKRILTGLCLVMSVSILSAFAAFSQTTAEIEPAQKQSLEASTKQYIESLGNLSEEELDRSIAQAEKQKNAIVFNGLTNYKNSLRRLGAFQEVESTTAVKTEDGYEVVVEAKYELREMKVTLGLDEDLQNFTEMSFAPHYTTAEEMKDAGGNLIVGMGTVFVVLIFIAWIISLLRYVNLLDQRRKERDKTREQERKADAVPKPTQVQKKVTPVLVAPAVKEQVQKMGVGGNELQAVIAAALMAYEAERENSTAEAAPGFVKGPALQNGLVVRSIRKR